MCNLTREIKCENLEENIGKLTLGSIDVMFKQDPECKQIFKRSLSGVTPTDKNDRFNTSSYALDQTLTLGSY